MEQYSSKHEEKVMDEEQLELLSQTLELLFSAGYFRAKIMGLGNFDKIVGGMVWCISQCAHKVDVDLLYSDNQTIGQKIALTERIVKVLPELSCPFSLEPHQIQGLDLEHIYPVVKWLVKEANFVRERLGNETLNFAVYQFGQQGWHFSEQMECVDSAAGVRPLVKRRPRKVYRRVKRMDAAAQPMAAGNSVDNQPMGQSYAAADEALEQNDGDDDRLIVMEEAEESAEIEGQQRHHDGIAGQTPVRRMVVYTEQQQQQPQQNIETKQEHSLEQLDRELKELEIEEAILAKTEAEEGEQNVQLKAEFEQLDEEERQRQKAYETHGIETVERLRNLLAQRDAIKADESAFKAQCRQRLAEWDTQIERLEQCGQQTGEEGDSSTTNGKEGGEDGGSHSAEAMAAANAQALLHDRMARARALAAEVGEMNRQIVRLSRRLGARPSRVELAQYQRKFVELCNQISAKHGETKRQYTLYNTLVSKRDFIQREIRLLNSIDDQRELAEREEYRDSLLDNLQHIGRGVDDSLDKMLCKRRVLQEQRDQLHNQLQMLTDKQRLYMKTVGEFQQACHRNEQLREVLENGSHNEKQHD